MAQTKTFRGKYHQVVLHIVGKITLPTTTQRRVKTFIISDAIADKIQSPLLKGEDMIPLSNGKYWRVQTLMDSALNHEVKELLHEAQQIHVQKLSDIKKAFAIAHYRAIQWLNGKIRVIRRFANKVSTCFEKLFAFDVKTGKMENLIDC